MGHLGLLYTPSAMVIAQTLLVTPLIAALARRPWRTPGATTAPN
jgi:ABC-type tungstate transport system substrate-binding protein